MVKISYAMSILLVVWLTGCADIRELPIGQVSVPLTGDVNSDIPISVKYVRPDPSCHVNEIKAEIDDVEFLIKVVGTMWIGAGTIVPEISIPDETTIYFHPTKPGAYHLVANIVSDYADIENLGDSPSNIDITVR